MLDTCKVYQPFAEYLGYWQLGSWVNMMAGFNVSGVWILAILTSVSYSYTTKKGLDDLNEGANPASSSNWEASAGLEHAALESSVARPSLQSAPAEQPGYVPSGLHMRSAPALYTTNTLAAPLGYDGSSSVALNPNFLVPSNRDIWAIQPPSPFYGGTSFSNIQRLFSEPQPLGLSPVRPGRPAFQPGEMSYTEKTYEHGNYDSESEDDGSLFKHALYRYPAGSPLALAPSTGRVWLGHPRNYMILSAPAVGSRRPSLFVKA